MGYLIISLMLLLVTSQLNASRTRMILEIVNSIDFDENSTKLCSTQINESNSMQRFSVNDECVVGGVKIELKSYLTKLSHYF